jgi:hypothetical protein
VFAFLFPAETVFYRCFLGFMAIFPQAERTIDASDAACQIIFVFRAVNPAG